MCFCACVITVFYFVIFDVIFMSFGSCFVLSFFIVSERFWWTEQVRNWQTSECVEMLSMSIWDLFGCFQCSLLSLSLVVVVRALFTDLQILKSSPRYSSCSSSLHPWAVGEECSSLHRYPPPRVDKGECNFISHSIHSIPMDSIPEESIPFWFLVALSLCSCPDDVGYVPISSLWSPRHSPSFLTVSFCFLCFLYFMNCFLFIEPLHIAHGVGFGIGSESKWGHLSPREGAWWHIQPSVEGPHGNGAIIGIYNPYLHCIV